MQFLTTNRLTGLLVAFSLSGASVAWAEIIAAAPPLTQKDGKGGDKGDKKTSGKKDDSKGKKGGDKHASKESTESKPAEASKGPATVANTGPSVVCQMANASAGLPGVTEASGVAVSRRTPGILWSHGDSYVGEPVLFAFDARGAVKGKVRLAGVKVSDWEDIAVAPCGSASCLFIGDIGDNQNARKSITIHRIPEPAPTDAVASRGEVFTATFPDGSHDAEAFFVSASGEMFVVTKGETGPVALYRFGGSPKAGASTQLQKVGVLQKGAVNRNQWVTGASASPDGKWVAMRTHGSVYFYDANRLMKGDLKSPLRFDATALKEPQGEGVALGPDGALFLAGEGQRKGAPGTLASGVCKLPTSSADASSH